jgi:hypothetical protein
LSLFTVIPLSLLISGRAWEADFVAIYGDRAHFADLRASLGSRFLSLFTVIALILLISGQAWEADFVAIYGDRVHFADLRASLGSRFCRYLR